MTTLACETPMSDHIESFWRYLETEHVRILVDMRRDTSSVTYWVSASFPDDVAKAIVAESTALRSQAASAGEWQPIETANKSYFKNVLLLDAELGPIVGYYMSTRHRWAVLTSTFEINPTHWMPLPAAPAASAKPAQGEGKRSGKR